MDSSYNNSFDSFVSSDAVVSAPNRENKKRWVIIGLFLSVVVVAIGSTMFFLKKKDNKNAAEAFEEIASYMEKVPEDYKWPELSEEEMGEMSEEEIAAYKKQENWIYAVLISYDTDSEIMWYYEQLRLLYDNFVKTYGAKIDNDLLAMYSNAISILEKSINWRKYKDELLGKYDNEGKDAANDFYSEKLWCKEEGVMGMFCQSELEYYSILLQEHMMKSNEMEFLGYFQRFTSITARTVMSNTIKMLNEEMLGELNV